MVTFNASYCQKLFQFRLGKEYAQPATISAQDSRVSDQHWADMTLSLDGKKLKTLTIWASG